MEHSQRYPSPSWLTIPPKVLFYKTLLIFDHQLSYYNDDDGSDFDDMNGMMMIMMMMKMLI